MMNKWRKPGMVSFNKFVVFLYIAFWLVLHCFKYLQQSNSNKNYYIGGMCIIGHLYKPDKHQWGASYFSTVDGPEVMVQSTEYRVMVQSTEYRVQSDGTEVMVQSTEYRVQSTEWWSRGDGTEYRVQSTEWWYRVQSTEW